MAAAIPTQIPPRALAYRLETGPSGLTFNPAAGLVTWTPTEVQGPSSYNVIVRATEVGGTQSSTLAFSIVVNETNEAPTLAPIPDRTLTEGTLVSFVNSASDTDLPAQNLRFSLDPGAPPEASVDPQSGVFTWPIGGDVGPSTNRITVRVTDDASTPRPPPARSPWSSWPSRGSSSTKSCTVRPQPAPSSSNSTTVPPTRPGVSTAGD